MKRILAAGIALAVAFLGGMAVRAASGTPEVDRANATMQLSGSLRPTNCVGEDAVKYVTYKGSFRGGESQFLPDPTDYGLTGSLAINAIQWTISRPTGRGVLIGTITLTNAAGAVQYAGKLTLVTQGLPSPAAAVPGRGWIVAAFAPPDEGTTPGDDSLIANVEFALATTSANGQFGDAVGSGSLGFRDFSVVTNVAPKALDGTC
jgi:hypothetical protein